MLHLSKNHAVRVFPWANTFRLASAVRFALASLLLQGKPSCQRAEDPHVGVRGVIEQEAKQETVSQRQESHAAVAMNRRGGGGGGAAALASSTLCCMSSSTIGHEGFLPFCHYKHSQYRLHFTDSPLTVTHAAPTHVPAKQPLTAIMYDVVSIMQHPDGRKTILS